MTEKAEQTSADTRRPSLTPSSGYRPSGFVPLAAWWLVRLLEPIGYVAAAAVGLGLWILLRDQLAGLPDTLTVGLLVASAAALWWAAWVVGNYPFAETWRLGNAIYAAAIGTTGWIAWVVTERALPSDARFTLTAGIVAVCSYLVQRFRGDLVTWILLIVAMFATAIASGVTLADSAEQRTTGFAAIGALAAAAGAYLIAGRAASARYQPTTLIVLAITIPTLLIGRGLPTALGIGVAVGGLGVALAAYFATRPATRIGKISAATDAALAVLIALVKIEVRFSILLIVAGSVVLAVLGWAAKRVFGSSPNIPPTDTQPRGTADATATAPHDLSAIDTESPPTVAVAPPQKTNDAADATATAPHDRSDVDTGSPPTVAVAPPQKTNGLAIASLILGLTWIFWIGSLLAVIFGHIALSQTDDSGGRGMAIAGLVLGYVALGVAALVAFALVVESGNL